MVLDIQGIGNILCDPEIATEDIVDIDDEFLFCLGNLAINAIQAFLCAHECNAYCEAVNIPDKCTWNMQEMNPSVDAKLYCIIICES